MTIARLCLWIIVALMICGSRVQADAQNNKLRELRPDSMTYSSLKLEVWSKKKRLSINDELMLDAALLNRGSQPLYLYNELGWGLGAGLSLSIRDLRTKQMVRADAMDDTLLPPPPVHDLSLLVRLYGGNFFGTRRMVPLRHLVPRPGLYEIRVAYLSVLDPDSVGPELRQLNVLWKGHPPIFSPWITIEVTP